MVMEMTMGILVYDGNGRDDDGDVDDSDYFGL